MTVFKRVHQKARVSKRSLEGVESDEVCKWRSIIAGCANPTSTTCEGDRCLLITNCMYNLDTGKHLTCDVSWDNDTENAGVSYTCADYDRVSIYIINETFVLSLEAKARLNDAYSGPASRSQTSAGPASRSLAAPVTLLTTLATAYLWKY